MTASRDGIVRARLSGAGRPDSTGVFTIPARMMRALPEGSLFRPEWHQDGILYRFLGANEAPVESDQPAWTRGEPAA